MEQLGQVLKVPIEGIDVHCKGLEQPILEHISMLDVFGKFKRDPTAELESSLAQTYLTPAEKALFIFVRMSLILRQEKRTTCNLLDLAYMECLMCKERDNFPSLFLKHLVYVKNLKKHSLVYGPVITTLIEHANVPLDKKNGIVMLKSEIVGSVLLNNNNLVVYDGKISDKRTVQLAEVQYEVTKQEAPIVALRRSAKRAGKEKGEASVPQEEVSSEGSLLSGIADIKEKQARIVSTIDKLQDGIDAVTLLVELMRKLVELETETMKVETVEIETLAMLAVVAPKIPVTTDPVVPVPVTAEELVPADSMIIASKDI